MDCFTRPLAFLKSDADLAPTLITWFLALVCVFMFVKSRGCNHRVTDDWRPYKDADECDRAERKKEERRRPFRRNVRIFLIRHGESEANLLPGQIGGRQNESPLSKKGLQQAMKLGNRLKAMGIKFEKVYSSTAVRAFETARIALPGVNVEKNEELLEQGQGDWEMGDRKKIMTEEILAQMNSDNWEFKAPQTDRTVSESPREVEERMYRFVKRRILAPVIRRRARPSNDSRDEDEFSEYEFENERKQHVEEQKGESSPPSHAMRQKEADLPCVAIFTHGGAIRYLTRRVLASNPFRTHRNMIENTSISEIVYSTAPGGRGGWFLHRFNDAAHLEYEKW